MTSPSPLDPVTHRDLRVRTGVSDDLGDGIMACLAVPSAFRRVQDCFPILFRLDVERDSFDAIALFGFEAGENLFVENGEWDASYKPLALDVQPFLIGRSGDGEDRDELQVDPAHPRIAGADEAQGVRVFEDDGAATPFLESVREKLAALDAGYRDSSGFFDALRRHDLLEPFTLDITFADGSVQRLDGYHAINEERLRLLDGAGLGGLHIDGHLEPLFMALASLSRIGALIDRRNARIAAG